MQLLSDRQWIDIARDKDLDSEIGIRKALSEVRKVAKNNFAPVLSEGLRQFVEANNGQLPNDLAQLKPYFKNPVDEAMLEQYKILHTGKTSDLLPGEWVIGDKAVIDNEYDQPWRIGPGSYGMVSVTHDELAGLAQELAPAFKAFSAANGGGAPDDISALQPYITTAAQEAAFKKLLKMNPSLNRK